MDDLLKLLDEVVGEALEIGAANWDSYLAPCRWPSIRESAKYKELVHRLKEK